MLDRLIAFCLLAHAVQAAILVADTKGWLSVSWCDSAACPVLGRWRLELARRLQAWRSSRHGRT
jgi:hypothetical protein